MLENNMIIFSAPWIIPVELPIIKNGSIVVAAGRIKALGPRDEVLRNYPDLKEINFSCLLMPGLVNAHMHLELSHLQGQVELQSTDNFTDWIDRLITRRIQQTYSRDEIVAAFTAVLHDQYRCGVVLIGDIGNEIYDELNSRGNDFLPDVLRMQEFLGPNRQVWQSALETISRLDEGIRATGHAPYSTAPELLAGIKRRCNRLQHIFSIHTGESGDEREFIQRGSGIFRDFLERRKSWDGTFSFAGQGITGTIDYFDRLGLLDEKTLLVHCVHLTESELQLIGERGSRICLCPGSNKFLKVGIAPLEKMLALDLLPALGTDSFASNQTLDIWREMQLTAEAHPTVEPAAILAMATLAGARALQNDELGSLAVGKRAKVLHVESKSLKGCVDGKQLVKELVSSGKPAEITWVSTVHEGITE